MLTQERLKQLVHYNPETGIFVWVKPPNGGRAIVGDIVGSMSHGYLATRLDGGRYVLHRLAFLYMTGELPLAEIDHINRIRDDNRWANLRECSTSENGRNRSIGRNNKSGVRGVDLVEKPGKKPQIRGSVSYSEFVNNPEGVKVWKKQTLRIRRSFIEGNKESEQKALAEVTEWLRTTREKHHGSFCNHD